VDLDEKPANASDLRQSPDRYPYLRSLDTVLRSLSAVRASCQPITMSSKRCQPRHRHWTPGCPSPLRPKKPPSEAIQPGQPQFCPGDLLSIGLRVSKVSLISLVSLVSRSQFLRGEPNFDLFFAILRIGAIFGLHPSTSPSNFTHQVHPATSPSFSSSGRRR
jgi:hypothetical protein